MAATTMAQPLDPARAVRVSATAAMWYKIRSKLPSRCTIATTIRHMSTSYMLDMRP